MKKLMVAILLILSLKATAVDSEMIQIRHSLSYEDKVIIMFKNSIDIDTKSLPGWIRIFGDSKEMHDYGCHFTEEQRMIILYYLKETKKANSSIIEYD